LHYPLVQALARRARLVSDIERLLPARKDPTQGFTVSAALLALIHGLLSGGPTGCWRRWNDWRNVDAPALRPIPSPSSSKPKGKGDPKNAKSSVKQQVKSAWT
jgi:hypothetical protein